MKRDVESMEMGEAGCFYSEAPVFSVRVAFSDWTSFLCVQASDPLSSQGDSIGQCFSSNGSRRLANESSRPRAAVVSY